MTFPEIRPSGMRKRSVEPDSPASASSRPSCGERPPEIWKVRPSSAASSVKCAPISERMRTVASMSCDGVTPESVVSPLASAAAISSRCVMLFEDGTRSTPESGAGVMVICIMVLLGERVQSSGFGVRG
ncbi:Uncharacterised protein [Bacteroides xylanisolvens]|nr:Uncharacterised protein [Bacteroides xylanisolvens]